MKKCKGNKEACKVQRNKTNKGRRKDDFLKIKIESW
jgi:hypothetical protein